MKEKRAVSAVEEINAMVKSAAWWNPLSWGNDGPSYTENLNYVQRHPADARGISRDAWDRRLGMQSNEIQRLRNMKPRTYLPSPGTRDPELARLMPGRSQQFWDSAWNRQDSLNRNRQIAPGAKSTQIINQTNSRLRSGIRDEGRKIVRQMIAARNGGAKIDNAKMMQFRDQYSRFRSGQMTDDQARAMLNGWRQYASTLKPPVQNKAMAQTPAANPAGKPGAV